MTGLGDLQSTLELIPFFTIMSFLCDDFKLDIMANKIYSFQDVVLSCQGGLWRGSASILIGKKHVGVIIHMILLIHISYTLSAMTMHSIHHQVSTGRHKWSYTLAGMTVRVLYSRSSIFKATVKDTARTRSHQVINLYGLRGYGRVLVRIHA